MCYCVQYRSSEIELGHFYGHVNINVLMKSAVICGVMYKFGGICVGLLWPGDISVMGRRGLTSLHAKIYLTLELPEFFLSTEYQWGQSDPTSI